MENGVEGVVVSWALALAKVVKLEAVAAAWIVDSTGLEQSRELRWQPHATQNREW